jgi:hypothetical protein
MIVKVFVKPRSGKDHIDKISENEYKVFLRAAAEGNKANIALIKAFSKYLNVPQKSMRIVSGLKSKEKILEVE